MNRGTKSDTTKEIIVRKVRVKEKAKAKERKEKEERKARTRTTARKERWTEPMELGSMVSYPSQSVVFDPGSSVSRRIHAMNSSSVQPACWSTAAHVVEDWPQEWCYDWESDWTEDWRLLARSRGTIELMAQK